MKNVFINFEPGGVNGKSGFVEINGEKYNLIKDNWIGFPPEMTDRSIVLKTVITRLVELDPVFKNIKITPEELNEENEMDERTLKVGVGFRRDWKKSTKTTLEVYKELAENIYQRISVKSEALENIRISCYIFTVDVNFPEIWIYIWLDFDEKKLE